MPPTPPEDYELRVIQASSGSARPVSPLSDTESTAGSNNATPGTYLPVADDNGGVSRFEHPRKKEGLYSITADCLWVGLPLAMAAFVAALWHLEGTPASDASQAAWDNGITVLATVFPIIFASVVGRLVSAAARWALERGATVGALEQLIGSRTVGSTVLTLLHFRLVNVMSLSLLLTWALSPLGTQGLLRMKSTRLEPRAAEARVTYFDNNAQSQLAMHTNRSEPFGTEYRAYFRALAAMYTTLIATPDTIKSDTMDLWGNVKIPFLDHAGAEWTDVDVSANLTGLEYSSLAGIPVSVLREGNTSFTMESNHLRLRCENVTVIEDESGFDIDEKLVPVDGSMLFNASARNLGIFNLPNGTWHGYRVNPTAESGSTWSLALDRFVDPLWLPSDNASFSATEPKHGNPGDERHRPSSFSKETPIDAGPTTLLFQAVVVNDTNPPRVGMMAHCHATQEYVESRVNCSRRASDPRQACKVVAQRPSRRPHASENISHLSFPRVFDMISAQLPRTVGGSINVGLDSSLYYLQDPSLSGMYAARTDLSHQKILTNITAEDLQIRLAQLLNTYLALTQLSHQIRGRPGNSVSISNQTVQAETSRLLVIYDISNGWAAACLLSSVTLLAAGVLGVVFKRWARGPDVLGHVSTVFRDSNHMDLPLGAGRLDGVALSRDMKDVRIRYGVTKLTKDGEPVIGVGLQETTEAVSYSR
ncbi:hypothetical protein CPLU01_11025 [Colletotrichum plurivorum]|uniref:Uncharacterized protein n=1 Tax=Colletotrichum plurivorum TaxID=2175906 RepID=A0A8H6K4H4_9PEZI|nr:hypothetical protein CPLU01_11025 [Colletotrichum plurivorum]